MIKLIKQAKSRGFTLVECLMVVSVIGGLLAAITSVFLLTLKGYTGEYEVEAVEVQSQRAAVELDYFIRRAVSVEIADPGAFSGNRLRLLQPRSTSLVGGVPLGVVEFAFTPNSNRSSSTEQVGELSITLMGNTYVYSGDIRTPIHSGVARRVFELSREGGLVYRWEVASLGSGVLTEGIVPLK